MTIIDFKGQAARLAKHLATKHGLKLKHSNALEAIAKAHGSKDWNTLASASACLPGLKLGAEPGPRGLPQNGAPTVLGDAAPDQNDTDRPNSGVKPEFWEALAKKLKDSLIHRHEVFLATASTEAIASMAGREFEVWSENTLASVIAVMRRGQA